MQGRGWRVWEEESLEGSVPLPHVALSLSLDQGVSGTQGSSRGRVVFRPHHCASFFFWIPFLQGAVGLYRSAPV